MSLLTVDSLPFEAVYSPVRKAATNKQEGRILIVDEDPSVRRIIHTTLYSQGFDIGEARTGEEAVALCHIVRYEAVLLDVGVIAKRGVYTCRELPPNAAPRGHIYVKRSRRP